MTLTEFLLARIAEDEEVAAGSGALWSDEPWAYFEVYEDGNTGIGVDRRRVLAECEAKRRMIAWCTEREQVYIGRLGDDPENPKPEHFAPGSLKVDPADAFALRFLALPYADHPDYLEEWRP